MAKVIVFLTKRLDGGKANGLEELHLDGEQIEFMREGYLNVDQGEYQLRVPAHRVDHIEVTS